MKRLLLQVFVAESDKALLQYQKAFDAVVVCSYPDENGALMHAELDIQGQILAISERNAENAIRFEETMTGNVMQFCIQFGKGNEDKVKKAYEVLKEGATIIALPTACAYSALMTDLVDKYGVRWCLFA